MNHGTPDTTRTTPDWYDEDYVRHRLNELVVWPSGEGCSTVRLTRLWPGARRIGMEWTLSLGSGEYLIQGAIGGLGERHRHDRVLLSDHGIANLRVADDDAGLYWCSPDRDPKLKHLGPLLTDRDALVAALPDELGTELSVDLLAYRMHRRCVLRIRGEHDAYVKIMRRLPREDQMAALADVRRRIDEQSNGTLRVPRTVLRNDRHPMIITEGPRHAKQCDVSSATDLSRAAHGISIVHDAPAPGGSPHGPAEELAIIQRWCGLLTDIDHWGVEPLCDRVADLQGRASSVTGDPCLVHRDFHEGQLLRDDDTMWLIDFDTLGSGHAEVDLATFGAHVVLDTLVRGGELHTALARVQEFLDTYASCGGRIDETRLRFYWPSALLRLGAIHCVRDVAPHIIINVWDLAGRTLNEPEFSIT